MTLKMRTIMLHRFGQPLLVHACCDAVACDDEEDDGDEAAQVGRPSRMMLMML